MNKVLCEDFDILQREYGEVFEILRNKTILVTGATGLLTTYLCKCILSCAEKYNIRLHMQKF